MSNINSPHYAYAIGYEVKAANCMTIIMLSYDDLLVWYFKVKVAVLTNSVKGFYCDIQLFRNV